MAQYIIMSMSIVGYVILVIYYARQYIQELSLGFERRLQKVQKTYDRLVNKKDNSLYSKRELEEESLEIFTLYEITKEITGSLNAEEAFSIFKKKLKEFVSFTECLYLEIQSEDLKKYKKVKNCFIFGLQIRRKKIANLVVTGVDLSEQEKLMILCHQFALALGRVTSYEEIERIAITDGLTMVHTRRYALDRLQEEVKRSKARRRKLSFLMIDVDFFKKYNDKYGHLAGDQILREVAGIIKDNIREIDIPGRYGGEEFCVVLPDTDRFGARYVSERIRHAAENAKIQAYDTTVSLTLSIGTASFPEDAKVFHEMVDKADWALYRAKKQGRNKVCSFGVYKK